MENESPDKHARRWRVEDAESGVDLITYWKTRSRGSNEYAAAEIIEELEREREALRHERNALQKICAERQDVIDRLEKQQADQSNMVLVPLEEYDRLKASPSATLTSKDAERYLDAIFQMADDGWLMHGEEGMSEVQEVVYKIAQEHPEYKRRASGLTPDTGKADG